MTTIYDPRYIKLIERLVSLRKEASVTQGQLASKLRTDQSTISKVEGIERRLDLVELYDWLVALDQDFEGFLQSVGWLKQSQINTSIPALPVPGKAKDCIQDMQSGVEIEMAWQGQKKLVFIAGLSAAEYLALEAQITRIYQRLNASNGGKNREAIFEALTLAIHSYPNVNPSDLYHHVAYRLYLREYSQTQADRSWVRAGGEGLELFLQEHYNQVLRSTGIQLLWLSNAKLREAAMAEMGISAKVGKSKLDIALYGLINGRPKIFGGIHVKASLAERVSDDAPCSLVMMEQRMVSYLLTFDAKSFPPPYGDLVNRGELGSPNTPTDKRDYIERHGSFDACFSYNLRTVPSGEVTPSGKLIYTSTFNPETDPLPKVVMAAFEDFLKR